MAINTATGVKFYISDSDITSTTDTSTEYAALTWVAVGSLQSLGEYGDQAADVTAQTINDARVRHAKGARDAGTMSVVVYDDPTDTGQLALVDAEGENSLEYGFKVELADKVTSGGTNSLHYFRGRVLSKRISGVSPDNYVMRTFNVGINSEIVEVVAT